MTQKRARLIVVATLALAFVAGLVIYRNYHDDEMSVYVALIQNFGQTPDLSNVAFMSVVSTCRVDELTSPDETELIHALQIANGPDALPRGFERLSDLANVVTWKETKAAHEAEGIVRGEQDSSKRLIRLSRVGFNAAHDRAILCFEPDRSGILYFFEKADGPFWRKTMERRVWVS
jgi:hypothetical protein